MKTRMLITLVSSVCLIVPLSRVVADDSQNQKRNEEQAAIPKNAQNAVKGLKKLREDTEKISKNLEPAQKTVTFSENVLSFETLDQVENHADLPKYGLVQPDQYNHNGGKNLVLLCLKATSFLKGPWVLAHGLLGVNMLETKVKKRFPR